MLQLREAERYLTRGIENLNLGGGYGNGNECD